MTGAAQLHPQVWLVRKAVGLSALFQTGCLGLQVTEITVSHVTRPWKSVAAGTSPVGATGSRGLSPVAMRLGVSSAFMVGFGGGGMGGAKRKCCPGKCLGASTCAAPSPGTPFLSLRAGYLYSCRFSGPHRIPRESPSGPLWTTVFHDLTDLSLISVSPGRL